jgi:hypothetical protein
LKILSEAKYILFLVKIKNFTDLSFALVGVLTHAVQAGLVAQLAGLVAQWQDWWRNL